MGFCSCLCVCAGFVFVQVQANSCAFTEPTSGHVGVVRGASALAMRAHNLSCDGHRFALWVHQLLQGERDWYSGCRHAVYTTASVVEREKAATETYEQPEWMLWSVIPPPTRFSRPKTGTK